MKLNTTCCLILAVAVCGGVVPAQTADLSGQGFAWGAATDADTRLGLRYIPELSLGTRFLEDYGLDLEAALDARWFGRYEGDDCRDRDWDVDPYRLWVRFTSPQLALRAGLQKISFGPATLLRPLMWFDTLDPRDPLSLTDGVYGLLGRYYFLNNANVWVWGLYGNDALRGWEALVTDEHDIEFGGRVQVPIGPGEAGLSYHHRRVNPAGSWLSVRHPEQGTFTEQRIGLDGKWDVGIGVWFEATLTHQDLNVPEPSYQRLLTVGVDYTFDIGNGPHVLFEQFVRSESDHAAGSGSTQPVSGLAVDYPLTLLDTVSAITYRDWDGGDWTHFLTWRRTYDRWQLHASAFWGPDRATDSGDMTGGGTYGGKGVQIMVVFNH